MQESTPSHLATAVLFLDFDGVIQTYRGAIAFGKCYSTAPSDPVLVRLLERVCESGVQIVVSSAWRDIGGRAKEKLQENGLIRFLHADWRTPDFRTIAKAGRPREIADWLSRHPEVTRFAILDDDPWEWTPEQVPHWYECCGENGMPAREMQRLADWAGIPKRIPETA